jgi:AcrR family transcriptional regulator
MTDHQAPPAPDAEPDGRRRRGAAARASILAHAVKVASVDGLEGVTIGGLASALGISKGNISVLFGDKLTLQLKTLDAAANIFRASIVSPALREASPRRRLHRLCDGWFGYVEQRVLPGGCMMYATANEYRARPGPIRDQVIELREGWHRLLGAAVRDAQAAGEIRGDIDVRQLVFELTALQAAANTAALLGDAASFSRARTTSARRIEEAAR